MNIEQLRDYCLAKPGVDEKFPFDETTLVFRVKSKMFALAGIENFEFVNLKCDPEKAQELRARYVEIKPGYHMNKEHWNSVYVNGSLNLDLVFSLIDHSYELVVNSLSKKDQNELRTQQGK